MNAARGALGALPAVAALGLQHHLPALGTLAGIVWSLTVMATSVWARADA